MLNLGLISFAGGIVHIILVVIYAKWAGWGYIGIRNRILGVPGGAMVVSPPAWEFLYVVLMPTTPTGLYIALIAGHMLAVRLLLNLIGVYAIFLRWTGKIDGIICMDDRTWAQAKNNHTCNNHSGLCGAFATMSFVGLTPALAIVGILVFLGFNVPLWLAIVATFPFFFVFGKHFHVVLFQVIGDIFHITEIPGWFVGSLSAKSIPWWQFCAYGGGAHSHD